MFLNLASLPCRYGGRRIWGNYRKFCPYLRQIVGLTWISDATLKKKNMRRIVIKEARPGMIAARTVAAQAAEPGTPAATLAAAGEVLTLEHLVRFHEQGI